MYGCLIEWNNLRYQVLLFPFTIQIDPLHSVKPLPFVLCSVLTYVILYMYSLLYLTRFIDLYTLYVLLRSLLFLFSV